MNMKSNEKRLVWVRDLAHIAGLCGIVGAALANEHAPFLSKYVLVPLIGGIMSTIAARIVEKVIDEIQPPLSNLVQKRDEPCKN